MTPKEERAYEQGRKAAWRSVLGAALRHLGAEGDSAEWAAERADVVAILRQVCEEYGDNDWPDDLHLGDAIEKHLWRHLSEGQKGGG